jgi:hypothetical protein
LSAQQRQAIVEYFRHDGLIDLPMGMNDKIAGRPNAGPGNFRTEILDFVADLMKRSARTVR